MCVGVNNDFRDFSVFSAKAIAGIGEVPGTIEDRSIVLELKRKSGTENTQRFRRKEAWASSMSLRERLEAWGANAKTCSRALGQIYQMTLVTAQLIYGNHCWQSQIWLEEDGLT